MRECLWPDNLIESHYHMVGTIYYAAYQLMQRAIHQQERLYGIMRRGINNQFEIGLEDASSFKKGLLTNSLTCILCLYISGAFLKKVNFHSICLHLFGSEEVS
jgi:hypothetical protein